MFKKYSSIKIIFLSLLFVAVYSCSPSDEKSEEKNTVVINSSNGTLVTAPEKKPMKLLTDRPPNLETPLKYFLEDFTPNDVFFVRWHLSNLPTQINADTFRLRVFGNVTTKLELSLSDLKTKFKIGRAHV